MPFSVRVEQKFTDPERTKTHVFNCAQYTLESQKNSDRKILSLFIGAGPLSEQKPTDTIVCDEDQRAFIMNDHGATIDIVPPLKRK